MNAFLSRLLATRAGRRALAATGWACFLAFVAVHSFDLGAASEPVTAVAILLGFTGYAVLLRVVQLQRGVGERPLDEREQAIRDRGHFVAFRLGNAAMLVVVIYAMLAQRIPGLWLPATPGEAAAALAAVAIAFGLLPATVLAWTTEDEPLDDEEGAPVPVLTRTPMPRAVRITLFGLAGVVAIAAALGKAGVVPALAARTSLLAGIATGMVFAGVVMTRPRNGSTA
jgi:hypothetical protein